jgi:hypothetical protein
VDVHYPTAEKLVLVMDNLNTHTPSSLYSTFAPPEALRILKQLEIHYTPVHGSWLHMAEIELSALARQCLSRRMGTQGELEREVQAWQQRRNEEAITVNWRFTTADARIKLKRLYPSPNLRYGAYWNGHKHSASCSASMIIFHAWIFAHLS